LADVVDPATRSRMMSGIRGKNTKPELLIRKALHARGFRYRLHCDLPGKPDICHLFKWPATRPEFWRAKIGRNQEVDRAAERRLAVDGWRVAVVWECALKGTRRWPMAKVVDDCQTWLLSSAIRLEIPDRPQSRDDESQGH
jgi:DNA mismatch endonuclease (patch repair protein)